MSYSGWYERHSGETTWLERYPVDQVPSDEDGFIVEVDEWDTTAEPHRRTIQKLRVFPASKWEAAAKG